MARALRLSPLRLLAGGALAGLVVLHDNHRAAPPASASARGIAHFLL